jgi:hypothetical protein
LYHHDASPPSELPNLETLVDWHLQWNASLGIWELNREMKALQRSLYDILELIVEGKRVQVPHDIILHASERGL